VGGQEKFLGGICSLTSPLKTSLLKFSLIPQIFKRKSQKQKTLKMEKIHLKSKLLLLVTLFLWNFESE
jgi:hypothetical protein